MLALANLWHAAPRGFRVQDLRDMQPPYLYACLRWKDQCSALHSVPITWNYACDYCFGANAGKVRCWQASRMLIGN